MADGGTIMPGMIDPQRWLDLVYGFAGSAIVLFVRPGLGKWEATGIIVVGLIAAYAGTEYGASFLPKGDGARGVTGLLIGMLAFYAAGRVLAFVRKGKLPFIGKEGRDGDR